MASSKDGSNAGGNSIVDYSNGSPAIDHLAPDIADQHATLFLSDEDQSSPAAQEPTSPRNPIVIVPTVQRPWEYKVYQDDTTVTEIIEEIIGQHEVKYLVKLADGCERTVSLTISERFTWPSYASLLRYCARISTASPMALAP